ncbi:MAG TPA: STAS domain-containing protein [Acidimicrobiia bacterium]|nr:STAS domain-containing protein [Acidimicrobiia bacterium]
MPESAIPFTVSVHADDGAVKAAIAGELDLATGPLVKENLRPFYGRRNRIVYELDRIAFIDSTGLEGLFDAVENGETIIFKNPSTSVRRILELLGHSVNVEESFAEAAGATTEPA